MLNIRNFNKDTDEYLLDKRYIHREYCIKTKRFFRRDKVRFYHYIYEVRENGNLYPVVEAISDREYWLVLQTLWSGMRQSPYGKQKLYEYEFGY